MHAVELFLSRFLAAKTVFFTCFSHLKFQVFYLIGYKSSFLRTNLTANANGINPFMEYYCYLKKEYGYSIASNIN